MSYARRTCHKCGMQKPVNYMDSTTVSYKSGTASDGITVLTAIGWLADHKTSNKRVDKALFGNSKRKYTRRKEVWQCHRGQCHKSVADIKGEAAQYAAQQAEKEAAKHAKVEAKVVEQSASMTEDEKHVQEEVELIKELLLNPKVAHELNLKVNKEGMPKSRYIYHWFVVNVWIGLITWGISYIDGLQ